MKWIGFLTIGCVMSSCLGEMKTCDEPKNVQTALINSDISLSDSLESQANKFKNSAPAEKQRIYNEGIALVASSGVLEKALNVGDAAINFKLSNARGKDVSLEDYLSKGPVILTWYRGGWCPYCNINLFYLQEFLPEFQKYNANLIALTPELPDKTLTTKEKNNLQYEVLSDIGNKVASQYNILYDLAPDVKEIYQVAFDLQDYNGDESYQLPLAATYVIDTSGTIVYAFLDADYKKRAEPSEVLSALEELTKKE